MGFDPDAGWPGDATQADLSAYAPLTALADYALTAALADYVPKSENIAGVGAIFDTPTAGDVLIVPVPFACTITKVTMLGNLSGSAVVDIWKDTYANHPPTVADTITAAAKPTISAATKSQDATLTGWTTAIAAGDILVFKVDSASTITKLTVMLDVLRT